MRFSSFTNTSRFSSLRTLFAVFVLLVSTQLFHSAPLSASSLNDTQIIKSDHWIYDSVYALFTRTGQTCPASTFPVTVGELKFLLRQIDTTELDDATSRLYDEAHSFLYDDADIMNRFFRWKNERDSASPAENADNTAETDNTENDGLLFSVAPRITPELYVKSNNDIGWFFSRIDPYLKDNFATLPVCLGFGNFFTIETDIFYGKNRITARENDNWINLPMNGNFDYLYPRFAYGSTGFFHENWGMSLHVANEGLTIGKTLSGSVIYNRTFETAAYAELNLFSKWAMYALDVVQVDYNRFMYLHNLEIRPFHQLKLELIEGGLVNGPIEMKYLNPLMIVHSWYPAQDYAETEASGTDGADHKYCAYMGIMVEYVPCNNLRLYALWAQNELQAFGELNSTYGKLFPDSYGLQVGAETFFSGGNSRLWKINMESVFTLPFLYMKHSAQSSLYRARKDNHVPGSAINSWIGTPFGPDCFALQTNVTCSQTGNWSAGLSYLLTIHGENGFTTFTDPRWAFEVDGVTYYAYYPAVKDTRGLATTEECIAEARNHWLSGTLEYRNDIVLNGSYTLNSYCSFDAQFVYTFVFNNAHKIDEFRQGVELAVSATFKYF